MKPVKEMLEDMEAMKGLLLKMEEEPTCCWENKDRVWDKFKQGYHVHLLKYLANPRFTIDQMRIAMLYLGVTRMDERGFALMCNPNYTVKQMQWIGDNYRRKNNYDNFLAQVSLMILEESV